MAINTADQDRWFIVYYPGPGIVVTNRFIETDDGRFQVRELDSIHQISINAHHALMMALIFGAIELVLAAPLAAYYGSPALLCVGFVAAFGLVAALLADHRRNPHWMALRAVHRGQEITLFSSRDQREFGQVRRAVIRAVEANESPRP